MLLGTSLAPSLANTVKGVEKMTVTRTDSQLEHDVTDELKWDTRLTETEVGVQVQAAMVTLTGTVDSCEARLAAQDAAHRVLGVLDVANEIRVKLPGSAERADMDIARAVRHALQWDVLVPHDRIRTTVSDGVVSLEGNVAHWNEHDEAARCVRNLAGVRHVFNFIRVDAPPRPASIEAVRRAIVEALEKNAEHAAKHVQIAMVNGEVTLIGQVTSLAERAAVEGAVRGTAGVCRVDNQLRIQA
jgi:osmotically-inducible protein OsmY